VAIRLSRVGNFGLTAQCSASSGARAIFRAAKPRRAARRLQRCVGLHPFALQPHAPPVSQAFQIFLSSAYRHLPSFLENSCGYQYRTRSAFAASPSGRSKLPDNLKRCQFVGKAGTTRMAACTNTMCYPDLACGLKGAAKELNAKVALIL